MVSNNMDLQRQVVDRLIELGYHISFAESCTGGMCCASLVDISDASKVLDMSFVTYANDAKIDLIGVNEKTIADNGVVSEQVASEMALGVSKRANSEVGVGVTGVAGPTGGTAKKPVGMVCFGFCINGDVKTYTMQFGDLGRNVVRQKSVDFVYQTLLDLLGE